MRHIHMLLLLTISLCSGQTSDPLASPQTKAILQYLNGLNTGAGKRIISGHQLNTQFLPMPSYDSVEATLFSRTGFHLGLIGIDYQRTTKGLLSGMTATNAPLIKHSRAGGLVAVMCSFTNPWTDSTMGDTTGRYRFGELLTSGTAANAGWMRRLDSLAAGFRQLQDSGVTVLFRPLHEMNGPWFWWGSQSAGAPSKAQWTALWKQMHSYLTDVKQLHNLLWVFAPSARPSAASNPVFRTDTTFYPGGDQVDIVGVDIYNDTLDIPSYQSLRSFGKPFALCEFGPTPGGDSAQRYDYRTLMVQVKRKYPDVVYWMSWNDFSSSKGAKYFGLTSQLNAGALLADPWVINRDALAWSTTAVVSTARTPDIVTLKQNYPNPFNPTTAISYHLSSYGMTTLIVYDLLGREVAALVNGMQESGAHSVRFDASQLASGIYFARLQNGASVQVMKMMLMK